MHTKNEEVHHGTTLRPPSSPPERATAVRALGQDKHSTRTPVAAHAAQPITIATVPLFCAQVMTSLLESELFVDDEIEQWLSTCGEGLDFGIASSNCTPNPAGEDRTATPTTLSSVSPSDKTWSPSCLLLRPSPKRSPLDNRPSPKREMFAASADSESAPPSKRACVVDERKVVPPTIDNRLAAKQRSLESLLPSPVRYSASASYESKRVCIVDEGEHVIDIIDSRLAATQRRAHAARRSTALKWRYDGDSDLPTGAFCDGEWFDMHELKALSTL